jgi:hypothetical protein
VNECAGSSKPGLGNSTVEATFRYVLHDDVEAYLHAGWEIAADLADCYHGEFGVLMLWPFDGPEDS